MQCIGFCQGHGFEVLGQALAARLKHGHGVGAQVDNATKQFALAHGPGHGHAGHAQFALYFVQNVQWVSHFAVHFVDESDDGCVALAADFNEPSGLGFYAVGRVNHHEGGVYGGEHAVGVFAKVFVARGV